jgi:hypothetical protein
MSEITFRPAWRLNDAQVGHDARELWASVEAIDPEVLEARAGELVAAAYTGARLVSVATAELSYRARLNARLAMYRTYVIPEERRNLMSRKLAVFSRDVLERWSADNPAEKVLGMGALIQAHEYSDRQRNPVWREMGLNLDFVGFTPEGYQLRVAWFQHARLEAPAYLKP